MKYDVPWNTSAARQARAWPLSMGCAKSNVCQPYPLSSKSSLVIRKEIHTSMTPPPAGCIFCCWSGCVRNMLQDALELANAAKLKPDVPRSARKVRRTRVHVGNGGVMHFRKQRYCVQLGQHAHMRVALLRNGPGQPVYLLLLLLMLTNKQTRICIQKRSVCIPMAMMFCQHAHAVNDFLSVFYLNELLCGLLSHERHPVTTTAHSSLVFGNWGRGERGGENLLGVLKGRVPCPLRW